MIRIQNNSHHILSLMKGSQETCKDERRKAFVSNWFMVVLSWGEQTSGWRCRNPRKDFHKTVGWFHQNITAAKKAKRVVTLAD